MTHHPGSENGPDPAEARAVQVEAVERLSRLDLGRVELAGLVSSLREAWKATPPGPERRRVEDEGRGAAAALRAFDGKGGDLAELRRGLCRLRELRFGLVAAEELGPDAPRCGDCGPALLLRRRGASGSVVVRCATCRRVLERRPAGPADLLVVLGEDLDPDPQEAAP